MTARTAAAQRLTVFCMLWCAAILAHQIYRGHLLVIDASWPLGFVALWGLLRPSAERLLVVAAAQLAVVAMEMPRVSNHWVLMGVTCVGMLVVLVPARLRGPIDPARVSESVLGPVRAQLVLVYVFATLAKLNSGFLDPALGCGAEHYRSLAGSVPWLPLSPWALSAATWGTLAIEGGLPVLLILRRTRPVALLLGWGFHAALGWNGYWDFSSVTVPYYAAFLPDPMLSALGRRLESGWPARLRRAATSPLAFPAAGLLLAAPAALAALSDVAPARLVLASNRLGRGLWLAAWLAVGAALLAALWATRARTAAPATPEPWWRRPALWIAPLLIFANGLAPYLGLKTEGSFAMFSNLRTEGDEWNHLLVPRSVRVFGYQDELIGIRSSSDPELRSIARARYRVVPFLLRERAMENPGGSLVYTRGGELRRAEPMAGDPFLARPVPLWQRKLMYFRPVPPRGYDRCRH